MTTEREQILALAGEPKAHLVMQINGHLNGVCVEGAYLTEEDADIAQSLLGTYWAGTDKLYTADQLLVARKPLVEEIERITHDRDAKSARMWELGKECDAISEETDQLRQQLVEKCAEAEEIAAEYNRLLDASILLNKQLAAANARIAELEAKGDPVFQLKLSDGSWVDQFEHSYEYNLKNGAVVRKLYIHAPQDEPSSDLDVLRRIAERGHRLAHEQGPQFVDLFQHMLDEIQRVNIGTPQAVPLTVKVADMRESNGRVTWSVFLAKSPDDALWDCHQVYSDSIEGRARYEAAVLNHFLGNGPAPNILAFDTDAPAPQAVPEGWKLVPIEPTDAMVVAALEGSDTPTEYCIEQCYRAMLAAAPSPEGEKK